MGITVIPLVLRFAAALDSYTTVAIIDISLVLFTIPQRMGAVIVAAVVPHATRAIDKGDAHSTITRREHLMIIVPFVVASAIVGFTPIVEWFVDLLG